MGLWGGRGRFRGVYVLWCVVAAASHAGGRVGLGVSRLGVTIDLCVQEEREGSAPTPGPSLEGGG